MFSWISVFRRNYQYKLPMSSTLHFDYSIKILLNFFSFKIQRITCLLFTLSYIKINSISKLLIIKKFLHNKNQDRKAYVWRETSLIFIIYIILKAILFVRFLLWFRAILIILFNLLPYLGYENTYELKNKRKSWRIFFFFFFHWNETSWMDHTHHHVCISRAYQLLRT